MFKSLEEIKNFVTWAKKNQVKSFKINDIAFEISELSFLPEETEVTDKSKAIAEILSDTDNLTPQEEEELLFWSVQK